MSDVGQLASNEAGEHDTEHRPMPPRGRVSRATLQMRCTYLVQWSDERPPTCARDWAWRCTGSGTCKG